MKERKGKKKKKKLVKAVVQGLRLLCRFNFRGWSGSLLSETRCMGGDVMGGCLATSPHPSVGSAMDVGKDYLSDQAGGCL